MNMGDKDDYLKRAEAEVAKAKTRLPRYAGGCSECRWSRAVFMDEVCDHPAVELAAFNVTDAYGAKRIRACSEQRDQSSVWGPVVCGPDGALFERRLSLWSRILGAKYSDDQP